jgi:hypothetical protein
MKPWLPPKDTVRLGRFTHECVDVRRAEETLVDSQVALPVVDFGNGESNSYELLDGVRCTGGDDVSRRARPAGASTTSLPQSRRRSPSGGVPQDCPGAGRPAGRASATPLLTFLVTNS